MTKADEKLDMQEIHLLAAAKELVDLLYRWNVIDEYDLCIQDDRNGGTPYHHVSEALVAVLKKLGVKNAESKMSFYEMVTSGMSPAESVEHIREHESYFEGTPC